RRERRAARRGSGWDGAAQYGPGHSGPYWYGPAQYGPGQFGGVPGGPASSGIQDTVRPAGADAPGSSYTSSSETTGGPQETPGTGPVWTEDDPLGLYVDEPPAPGPSAGVAAPRRRWVKPLVLLAAAAAVLIASSSGSGLPAAFAIGLCTLGIGMVLGGFVGRTRGLLPVGVLMVGAIAATSAFHTFPDVADQSLTPTYVTTNDDYGIDVGSLKLDLTKARFAPNAVVHVHAKLGEIQVVLPPDVDVEGSVSASRAGSLEVFGQKTDGHRASLPIHDLGADRERSFDAITLYVDVQFGDIKVVRG
ncbi:MAG TPA: LiaF domain-containing protein, partial [Kribbellaceae bacterium]